MLKLIILIFSVILPISPLEAKYMDVVKGLKPAIAAFNHSEKNLINQVAERVKENGFPLYAVTQVYLKNESTTNENITQIIPLFLESTLRFISFHNKGQPWLKSIRVGKTQLLFIILMVVLTFF